MKNIRVFDSQSDFNAVYNGSMVLEVTSLAWRNGSSPYNLFYNDYAGQVGNLYKWGTDLYTSTRNPERGDEFLDSSGNRIGEYGKYIDDRLVKVVGTGGYEEPWFCYSNGNVGDDKPKLYTGGPILDLRDLAHNPNVEYIGNNNNYSINHFIYTDLIQYGVKDFVFDYAENETPFAQYVLTDFEPGTGKLNIYGIVPMGTIRDGKYSSSYYNQDYVEWIFNYCFGGLALVKGGCMDFMVAD